MLARRIISVSPDKAFGKRLATALKAAGGAVDSYAAVDEIGKGEISVALVVLHLEGALASAAAELVPRMTGDTRVIAILPKSNLAAVIDIMQSSERIAGILVAEDLEPRILSAMATRILAGDIFGLEKMISWGTHVHSQLVGDYQEKSLCISQISEFAELMGVRRKYRESIEQCVDEMLMNALYDAPVDEQGQPIFSEIPTKTRISLRVEQKVVVQYACDGERFVVTVRDSFGTLERATVLRYLHKCLHADEQIESKVGGAGLGLYLMVNSASSVDFNVLPGIATEVACVFELDTPKQQLEEFGFFTEKIDAAGRLAAGTSRRLPAGASHPVERRAEVVPGPSRGLVAGLTVAIGALFVLIGVLAWPRMFGGKHTTRVLFTTVPQGATIEIEGRNYGSTSTGSLAVGDLELGRAYPVVARLDGYEPKQVVVQPHDGDNQVALELQALAPTVELDSLPSGATVEVDGKTIGTTPVTLTSLAPGTSVGVNFHKPGYHDAPSRVDVPGPGKKMKLVQPLTVSDEFARVKLESEPPGAQVTQNGHLLPGVSTPAEVLVEAGKPQRFTLTLSGHVPAVIDPFTPARGDEGIVKKGTLVEGVSVQLSSSMDGHVTVSSAPHCRELVTPAQCVLAPGTYTAEFTGAFGAHGTHTIQVGKAPISDKFEFGFIQAGPGKLLQLGNGPGVRLAAFEVGPHRVTVSDDTGATHPFAAKVTAGSTVIAN